MARRRFLGPALLVMSLLGLWATADAQSRGPDVEYVPTPPDVVMEMLLTAGVNKADLVYDLGCGDGRFVITAAKVFGARGVGVDIDPDRVRESDENARKEGVTDRVRFVVEDLFTTDVREATVVALYLLPELNVQLRPKLLRELRPGARVVSHEFDMGDWTADIKGVVRNAKFYASPHLVFEQDVHFYSWVVPANAAGDWHWRLSVLPGTGEAGLHLNQKFQAVDGTLSISGGGISITDARLTGDLLSFTAALEIGGRKVVMRHSGRVAGNAMQGSIEIEDGPFTGTYPWTARRIP